MPGEAPDVNPLAPDPEAIRRMGYRTVDLLAELLAGMRDAPPIRRASRDDMEARLAGPPSAAGLGFDTVLAKIAEDVLPFAAHCDHPRYLAFIPGSATWPGALGDLIASAVNLYSGSWMEGSGPSQLELTVLGWFKDWIGYPFDAAGILVSGGSAANMHALACAREALLGPMNDRVVAYVSDQAHSSMARAARILGFQPDQVRVLPVDDRFRLRPDALIGAMDADVRAGHQPLFVSASAGSTNTGAIDPLQELAAICRDRGAWLHVDAAYGGFAAITARGKERLAGIELADSVTLDPHKWLFQPFECGAVLVRDGRLLRRAFQIAPEYLQDSETGADEVNFSDLGMQLTRTSRALKVWMSIETFGLDAFRAAIDRSMDIALAAETRIRASDAFELLSPAALGVVCFRRRPAGVQDEAQLERINAALVAGLEATGRALISSTRLRGRFSLRICVLNPSTRAEDVDWVLDWLETAPVSREAAVAAHAPVVDRRNPDVRDGWLGEPDVDPDLLRAQPIFVSLDDAALDDVARNAWERSVPAGGSILERWEPSREFYVLVEGTAEARSDDRVLRELGPGDFFGELAALDWGASYGYARLASVVATSDVRLVALPPGLLQHLVRSQPGFAAIVRSAAAERVGNT